MRHIEINNIIKDKILELDETEDMKAFLIDVIESELRNLDAPRARYMQEYIRMVIDRVRSEKG